MRKLNLSHNRIDDSVYKFILKFSQKRHPYPLMINLKGNNLSRDTFRLLNGLMMELENFIIKCNIPYDEGSGRLTISEGDRVNFFFFKAISDDLIQGRIGYLSLKDVPLDDKQLFLLAKGLRYNVSLHQLELQNTTLNDGKFLILHKSFSTLASLCILDISHNDLKNLQVLGKLKLESLDVSFNPNLNLKCIDALCCSPYQQYLGLHGIKLNKTALELLIYACLQNRDIYIATDLCGKKPDFYERKNVSYCQRITKEAYGLKYSEDTNVYKLDKHLVFILLLIVASYLLTYVPPLTFILMQISLASKIFYISHYIYFGGLLLVAIAEGLLARSFLADYNLKVNPYHYYEISKAYFLRSHAYASFVFCFYLIQQQKRLFVFIFALSNHAIFFFYEMIILEYVLCCKPYYKNRFNPEIQRNGMISEMFYLKGLSISYNGFTYENFRVSKIMRTFSAYCIHSLVYALFKYIPMVVIISIYIWEERRSGQAISYLTWYALSSNCFNCLFSLIRFLSNKRKIYFEPYEAKDFFDKRRPTFGPSINHNNS